MPFSLENLLAATYLDQLLCLSIWSQCCPLCCFLCLRWCLPPPELSNDILILLGCISFFYLNIILWLFFFSFWDSINWIWFTHVYLNQCRCKVDQLVIKLKFNLGGKGILNLLNVFIVKSYQVVPKNSPYCFSLLPRIAGLFTR